MLKLKNKILKNKIQISPFISDVIKLSGGTALAQILAIFTYPLITRIYQPDAFGTASLFISIGGIFVIVASLRYELAIMLPKKDNDAANILLLCLIALLSIISLSIIIIYFEKDYLLKLFNIELLAYYIDLIPIYIFFTGLFAILTYWNTRSKHFGRLSIARVTSSLSTIIIQIGLGIAGYTTGGSIILARILGSIISTLLLGLQILRFDKVIISNGFSSEKIQYAMVKYKKFPLIDAPSAFLNSISWQIPIFILSFFFSPSIVGFYSLCNNVIYSPLNLLGASISQVTFQQMVEARSNNTLEPFIDNLLKFLVSISLFPSLILTLIGDDLFIVLFGNNWFQAGVYAQILGPWAFILFLSYTISVIYVVFEKQEFAFKLFLANLFIRYFSMLIGGFMGNPTISILLFGVSGIFVYIFYLKVLLSYVNISITRLAYIILLNFKSFLPAGIIICILKLIHINSLSLLILSISLLLIYYYSLIKNDLLNIKLQ